MRQVTQNIWSVEGLVKIGEDGRATAWLAQSWEFTPDGRTLKMHLRPDLKFHDGSAVSAPVVAHLLETLVAPFMGPAFADVESIAASGQADINIRLRQRSPFVLEALGASVAEPGASQGRNWDRSSLRDPTSPTDLKANDHSLPGPADHRPARGAIRYPSARAAWAEMLRNNLDMLYEVSADALDSLGRSNQIQVFNYLRHYRCCAHLQHPAARRSSLRRSDRLSARRSIATPSFAKRLGGHGIPSSGPIWPRHWAVGPDLDKFAVRTPRKPRRSSRAILCTSPVWSRLITSGSR